MAQNEHAHASIKWRALNGWLGGTITAIALSPHFATDRLALVGTLAGIFSSTDGGASWQRADRGLDDPQITTLATATTTTGTIAMAATQSGQLYRAEWSSTPATIAWQPVDSWAGLGVIQALAFSPAYRQDHTLFTATSDGVFRSLDEGATWESSTFGLIDLDILCLACAPDFAENELLWAGSAGGGLYRSRNGARSWRDSGVGLPDTPILALHISPNYREDQTLYAATESDGIYRSTDGSASWHPFASTLAGMSVNAMASDATRQQWLVATAEGLLVSSDGGATWMRPSAQQAAVGESAALTVALANGHAFVGAFLDGLYHSDDGGVTWSPHNQGLIAHAAPFTQLTPTEALWALDVDGLLARYDRENNAWLPLNHHDNDAAVTAIAATTMATKPIIAATESELLFLLATGEAQQRTPLPEAGGTVTTIAPSPTIADDQTIFIVAATGRLWRTIDQGTTWQALNPPWAEDVVVQLACSPFFLRDARLYAVTASVATTGDSVMLTLWQSSDQGTTWDAVADLPNDSATIAMHLPRDPVTQPVLLATRNRLIKLYGAEDEGATADRPLPWQVEQYHLPEHVRITNIVTTATFIEDRTIYVTTTQGVYVGSELWKNADGAMEWQQGWPEIAEQTVVGLHCTKNGEPLYLVTIGGGLWQATP